MLIKKPVIDIIYRTCTRVASIRPAKRIPDAAKSELVIRCLNSLLLSLASAKATARFYLVDDASPAQDVDRMRSMLDAYRMPYDYFPTEERGNSASLKTCIKLAEQTKLPAVYFCEDDYLHSTEAIREMLYAWDIFYRRWKELVLFPCDYPDRYTEPYPSSIFLGRERYWRTVRHTTGTLIISREAFTLHRDKFYKLAETAKETGSVNDIYETVPCLSPMPTLVFHMQTEATISPLSDWRKVWDASAYGG